MPVPVSLPGSIVSIAFERNSPESAKLAMRKMTMYAGYTRKMRPRA